ncbi:flavin reductase [Luteibacter rhizovicinus]|uniref:flavin reductase n=1 Tax=Luteibacter rhizovicinus TaxID=242606 RepID=UPI001FCDBDF1|nr:flavin reductase [Luteibacter rhizovicinus]
MRPLPQWATIALASPQQVVTATLRWDSSSADVTVDHTVASLNPLVIATSVDAGQHPVLEYRDNESGKLLGALHLVRDASDIGATSLAFYRVASGDHHCLSVPRRSWNAWLQNRMMRKNRSSNGLNTDPVAVQQLMIAYLCPKPVVLVSVNTDGHQNIFPMDLIGPLDRRGYFSLALRTTNVSVPILREARRVALSHVPATMKQVVYRLSEHHKQALTDWSALPFAVRSSREFGIPVVAEARRVQELTIVHSQEIGLHTFFVCRVVSDETGVHVAQLHHTAGFHQAHRLRRRVPFAEV